jgi:hypothetical protein
MNEGNDFSVKEAAEINLINYGICISLCKKKYKSKENTSLNLGNYHLNMDICKKNFEYNEKIFSPFYSKYNKIY